MKYYFTHRYNNYENPILICENISGDFIFTDEMEIIKVGYKDFQYDMVNVKIITDNSDVLTVEEFINILTKERRYLMIET